MCFLGLDSGYRFQPRSWSHPAAPDAQTCGISARVPGSEHRCQVSQVARGSSCHETRRPLQQCVGMLLQSIPRLEEARAVPSARPWQCTSSGLAMRATHKRPGLTREHVPAQERVAQTGICKWPLTGGIARGTKGDQEPSTWPCPF